MDPTPDSSPLKRFCTFWFALAAFAAFGLLAVIVSKATGGDSDPAYAASAEKRSAIREGALEAQAEKLAAAPIDLAAAATALAAKKPVASSKPAPGTNAFDEWMAAQAAAAAAAAGGDSSSADTAKLPGEVMKPKETKPTVIELELKAIPGGVMKYAQTELTVKAGAAVVLTFINPDVMPHNFLLLKPGTMQKVGTLADAMLTDPDAMKKQYVPESDDILVASKLVAPAGIEVLKFTAPTEPGAYPYICTFPGHWRLMFGTLEVTP